MRLLKPKNRIIYKALAVVLFAIIALGIAALAFGYSVLVHQQYQFAIVSVLIVGIWFTVTAAFALTADVLLSRHISQLLRARCGRVFHSLGFLTGIGGMVAGLAHHEDVIALLCALVATLALGWFVGRNFGLIGDKGPLFGVSSNEFEDA